MTKHSDFPIGGFPYWRISLLGGINVEQMGTLAISGKLNQRRMDVDFMVSPMGNDGNQQYGVDGFVSIQVTILIGGNDDRWATHF